ncbi:CCA tRNA nucleotidyltransferase [Bacillus horti]|uniref:tRNA nucleotidyltransferase (CCA-adding enzyme) n=1 Tax=Caldalkalibacillus horti TaxID=77523 RepID=A0ABT9VWY2_9BACI|nr:CCA tRNA nucleotidyltransferase [Bacillus horti]MDQ0165501.1 tRNA nucleotidyltransferase (CCA-adding enzyme) [Bacillus horti]
MKLDLDERFSAGIDVIKRLEDRGYEAYFIGGCVRDLLLNRQVADIDLCSSAKPEEVIRLFSRTIPTGLQHGTVTVLWRRKQIEVTTFRTEQNYANHRHPKEVQFVSTLAEDCKRRDFTINAIAMDKDGRIIDYEHGVADLERKQIKTVGHPEERFQEDALRMLRAIRFSTQLRFSIQSATYEAIKRHKLLLQHIAKERISVEFQKVMQADAVQQGVRLLLDSGIAGDIHPFSGVTSAFQSFSTFDLQELSEKERWVLLLFLVADEEKALHFLKQNMLPKLLSREIRKLTKLCYAYPTYRKATHFSDLMLVQLGQENVFFLLLMNRLVTSPSNDYLFEQKLQHEQEIIRSRIEHLPLQAIEQLAISGEELAKLYMQRKKGQWIQQALERLLLAVVNREVENERDRLIAFMMESEGYE